MIGLLNEFKTDIMLDSTNKSKTTFFGFQTKYSIEVQNRKWNSEILLIRERNRNRAVASTLIVSIEVSIKCYEQNNSLKYQIIENHKVKPINKNHRICFVSYNVPVWIQTERTIEINDEIFGLWHKLQSHYVYAFCIYLRWIDRKISILYNSRNYNTHMHKQSTLYIYELCVYLYVNLFVVSNEIICFMFL